jgi:molybdopterin/thiamine biosynthesis adenylyltransferase
MTTRSNSVIEVRAPRFAAPGDAWVALPLGMALMGSTPDALDRLRELTVGVIGCGSVGGRIALLLARLGFGGLLTVDPKNYKAASLATHEIDRRAVGQPKALVVAQRCKAINPAMRVRAFMGPVQALEVAALAGVDLIVMAPDLLAVELHTGQCALWLEKPLFHASVYGPALTLHVRSFLNQRAEGPCPVCRYGRAEFELLSRQTRFSCEGAAAADTASAPDTPRTNSLSPLCSMAADMAVLTVLRFLLKLGQPVSDTILEYCAFTHRTVVSPMARNPNCKLDHAVFSQAAVLGQLADLSLAELSLRATGSPIPADGQFELGGYDWVECAACNCAQPAPLRQFVSRTRPGLGRCPKCSVPVVPLSFYTHRVVGVSVLNSATQQPLRKLGVRQLSSVLLRVSDRGVLIRSQPTHSPLPSNGRGSL